MPRQPTSESNWIASASAPSPAGRPRSRCLRVFCAGAPSPKVRYSAEPAILGRITMTWYAPWPPHDRWFCNGSGPLGPLSRESLMGPSDSVDQEPANPSWGEPAPLPLLFPFSAHTKPWPGLAPALRGEQRELTAFGVTWPVCCIN